MKRSFSILPQRIHLNPAPATMKVNVTFKYLGTSCKTLQAPGLLIPPCRSCHSPITLQGAGVLNSLEFPNCEFWFSIFFFFSVPLLRSPHPLSRQPLLSVLSCHLGPWLPGPSSAHPLSPSEFSSNWKPTPHPWTALHSAMHIPTAPEIMS